MTFLRILSTTKIGLTSMHNVPAQPKLHPHVNKRGKHHRACPEIKMFQCYGHFATPQRQFSGWEDHNNVSKGRRMNITL